MFIRIKKIKNQKYAYLVKNIWRKRKNSSRQKVVKYLGKVVKLEKSKNITLKEFLNLENIENYIKENDSNVIIKNLIQKELNNYSFKETGKEVWIFNNIKINLKEKTILGINTKKELCLEINNNFLCSFTLKKLLNFKPKENLTSLQIGKELANNFESAGILVPKEVFVEIARKILKDIEK